MIGGTKFPADVKLTCTKPALPNRRRVTLFLSTFAAQTYIHRETKERPFGLSPLRSGMLRTSANQNLSGRFLSAGRLAPEISLT